MNPVQRVSGVLVALVERAYEGFTDSNGRQVQGGVTRAAWVVEDPSQDPVRIRVPDVELFGELRRLGNGGALVPVVIACELRANRNRLEYRAVDVVVEDPSTLTADGQY